MPRHCIAAGCNTAGEEGYSLHGFPHDADVCAKGVRAVKRQRSNWDGPTVVVFQQFFDMVDFFAINRFSMSGHYLTMATRTPMPKYK